MQDHETPEEEPTAKRDVPASVRPSAAAPSTFGKYLLHRRIALGGMAEIYLASLRGPDGFEKRLVVKKIHQQYADHDAFLKMFIKEARVAACLHHPHIVQVYEYGKIEETPYLAMELVEGASLNVIMKRAARAGVPLGPRMAAAIGVPVADALHYAHELVDDDGRHLGVVHRDVSPGNILVSYGGEVKLTDFGVVKVQQGEATEAGVVKGKYAYMAPEQARGHELDRRADIFSLGVVLYEVSTGRRLFRRDTPVETLTCLLRCEVPPPTSFIEDYPADLERVILKALSPDPAQRHQTAEALAQELEVCAENHGWQLGRRALARTMQAIFMAPGGGEILSPRESSASGSLRTPTLSSSGGQRFLVPPLPSDPDMGGDTRDLMPTVEDVSQSAASAAPVEPSRGGIGPTGYAIIGGIALTVAFWLVVLAS